jgi:integrase
MTIRIRKIRDGVWEVDIFAETPEGRKLPRHRKRVHLATKQEVIRWANRKQTALALGLTEEQAPTLRQFAARYFAWLPSRGHKQSGIDTRERAIRLHVLPVLGDTALNEITEEGIGSIAAAMVGAAPRTINLAISTLGSVLRVAVRWHVIRALPCPVDLVQVPQREMPFLDFDEYAGLVAAAERIDWKAHLAVLLGGRAGLRRGEILGFQWSDLSLDRNTLRIRRQRNNGRVSAPKGGKERTVDLSADLRAAVELYRHVRGDYVICWDDGAPVCESALHRLVNSAAKSAGVAGGIHILRHTFISHLAMAGVPARAIQRLAGHRSLATTMGYMHLSPGATASGIAVLDARTHAGTGNVVVTPIARTRNGKADND